MKRLLCLLLMLILSVSISFAADKAENRKYSVYVVNSYDPETFEWTKGEIRGIIQGFEQQSMKEGMDYALINETMDALVKSSNEEKKKESERILKDIASKKPDIVITTDDDALIWIALKISDIPVVFNGINGNPSKYLDSPKLDSIDSPGHNITGVYQTTYYQQSLEFLKKVSPDIKTFNVITAKTTTGLALLKKFEKIRDKLPLSWKETYVTDQFSEFKAKITEWQNKTDALFIITGSSLKDEKGNKMMYDQVFEWVAQNSKLPDTACWGFQIKAGVLLSATDSAEQQGIYASNLAVRILREGANPGLIPMVTPPDGVPALNQKRAEKLNLTIPEDLLQAFIDSGQIF